MNQIRSPMAEFLTRNLFGKSVFALSAGLERGDEDGFMRAVMAEKNIDVSGHVPETLENLEDHFFDLVVALTQAAREECHTLFENEAVEIEYWSVRNPSSTIGRREEILQSYRETRDEIERRIIERFE